MFITMPMQPRPARLRKQGSILLPMLWALTSMTPKRWHKCNASRPKPAALFVRRLTSACPTAGRDETVVLVISADLPFAQGRFCEAEGIADVVPLSLMRSRIFAKDYGVLMTDGPLAGITARAVVVLDDRHQVVYTELVPEIADEPNYAAALAVL